MIKTKESVICKTAYLSSRVIQVSAHSSATNVSLNRDILTLGCTFSIEEELSSVIQCFFP